MIGTACCIAVSPKRGSTSLVPISEIFDYLEDKKSWLASMQRLVSGRK